MGRSKAIGHCAICGSDDREVVQTQFLALLNRDDPCRIDFSLCRACGHLQQWPQVAPELMAYHYRTFATYEEFGDAKRLCTAPPSRHAQRFLSLVADLGITPGRAYEVGCASGAMLHQFRNRGWQVRGCDPSPSAIAQAKNIFGIEADLGSEEDAIPHQKNLDLILLCHVLEHLYDPPAALARFHAALAPHGYLVLEVPCAVGPKQLPPGWFTFEHLHYYQPATLENMLRGAGFEPIESRIEMNAQHYPVIAIAARKTSQCVAVTTGLEPLASSRLAHTYVARDEALWAATAERLRAIRQPVFLYGAGIHTSQLLDRTDLAPQVIAIADRDPKKWGQLLAGKPVISPAELFAHTQPTPVVISSYVSEKQIVDALLKGGIAAARIIPLYCDPPTQQPDAAPRYPVAVRPDRRKPATRL
ncbi:MAG TPA: methyltransferase domain-containing protein [Rhizomicrobium sp.]|nr:methyltransferase domain-containing protein [Rhizomicrobium sp.]